MSGFSSSPRVRALLPGLLLAGLIAVAYAASLRGEFLWDDDLHVTANPTIIGPLGLKEIWTTARANYFPLVLTNFWLQHALWGVEPLGYRVMTLCMHVVAAVLLWRVLLRMQIPGAWLGAALWALHPVQVESVAWICELKNTQSAVFFLAAILCHLRWLAPGPTTGSPARRLDGYALTFACALLAILSKPSTVMLPPALALASWWVRRRFGWRDLWPLLPFFALSALAAGWTVWEQKHHSGASGEAWNQTPAERVVIAGRAIWFYAGKLAWPDPLIFIYPRWSVAVERGLGLLPGLLAGALLVVLWRGRNRRVAMAGAFLALAYFVTLLFPVLGFFSVYFFRYSFVGDHFQYLASMGPLAWAGAVIASAGPGRSAPARAEEAGVRGRVPVSFPRQIWPGGIVLAVFVVLTVRESREYRSNETLWRATLADNPQAIMAWLNLGDTLAKRGKPEEAIATFRKVTRLKPDEADAYNDLGGVLLTLGRVTEAEEALARAVALAPRRPEMHNNLGSAQRALGKVEAAQASYRRALELDPRYAEAHNNLGAELAEHGDTAAALDHFQTALRLAPQSPSAHNNLGNALRGLGRMDEAIAQHREALRLKPDFADALGGLGSALALSGRIDEGLSHLQRAVQLSPRHAGLHGQLGRGLVLAGRVEEAYGRFAQAVALAPESAEARNNLGTWLAQARRGDEAVAEFEQAVRLAPRLVSARMNLGMALLATSRWSAAARQFEVAAELRPEDGEIQARLAVARVNAGRLEEAVPAFVAALRLNPDSAEVHDHFAQVLRTLGRQREALEHFERAADLRRAPRKISPNK